MMLWVYIPSIYLTLGCLSSSASGNPSPDSNTCEPTPEDALGPFYVKKTYTLQTSCIAFGKNNPRPGNCDDEEYIKEPIRIQGKILDSMCKPVEGAVMEYWQAAPAWSVSHPEVYTMVDSSCTGIDGTGNDCIHTVYDVQQCEEVERVPDCINDMEYKAYRGWQTTKNGNYQLNTVRPGIYDIRPIRHIHIKITIPGKKIGGKSSLITQLYLPQDEPTKDENIYGRYIRSCEYYRINPEQWAKKQELNVCPVRNEPEGATDDPSLTVYNWDVVLDI